MGGLSGPTATTGSNQYITAAERAQYEAQFLAADTDRDGYVSGLEIRHVLLDTGLPQPKLAQIW